MKSESPYSQPRGEKNCRQETLGFAESAQSMERMCAEEIIVNVALVLTILKLMSTFASVLSKFEASRIVTILEFMIELSIAFEKIHLPGMVIKH